MKANEIIEAVTKAENDYYHRRFVRSGKSTMYVILKTYTETL